MTNYRLPDGIEVRCRGDAKSLPLTTGLAMSEVAGKWVKHPSYGLILVGDDKLTKVEPQLDADVSQAKRRARLHGWIALASFFVGTALNLTGFDMFGVPLTYAAAFFFARGSYWVGRDDQAKATRRPTPSRREVRRDAS